MTVTTLQLWTIGASIAVVFSIVGFLLCALFTGKRLQEAQYLISQQMETIDRFTEGESCDHSVGICFCEIRYTRNEAVHWLTGVWPEREP